MYKRINNKTNRRTNSLRNNEADVSTKTAKTYSKEKKIYYRYKTFTNSIRQSINIIKKSGMTVFMKNTPKEDGFEITIRVKK